MHAFSYNSHSRTQGKQTKRQQERVIDNLAEYKPNIKTPCIGSHERVIFLEVLNEHIIWIKSRIKQC